MKNPLPISRLLWIDGFSALIAGILLFTLRRFLSEWLGLPVWLLTAQSAVNFCYATYSLSLAQRKHRPKWMIQVLIGGNLAYPVCVVGLLWWYSGTCTVLGVVYFLLEIVFIAGLGVMEWLAIRRTKGVSRIESEHE